MVKVLIFLLVFSISVFAKSKTFEVFEDKASEFTPTYIIQNHNKLFSKTDRTSFGNTLSTIWVKIPLKNNTNFKQEKFIRFSDAFINSLDLYYLNNENLVHLLNGSKISVNKRDVKSYQIAFKVPVEKNSLKNVFIKIVPKYATSYTYTTFDSQEEFYKHQLEITSFWTVYFTISTMILVLFFIIWIIFKDKLYLFYSLFIFSTIILQLSLTGLILKIINITWIERIVDMSTVFIAIALILFLDRLFLFKKNFSKITKYFNLLLIGLGIFLVVLLFDISFSIYYFFVTYYILVVILSIIAVIIYLNILKVRYSLYALIGIMAYLLTAAISDLHYSGTPTTEHYQILFQMGSLIEITAFALLLIVRMYNIKQYQFLKEQKLTTQLKELNEELEDRVKIEVEKNTEKEKQIFEQAKYASMGEMIGNIAHQWRQPLNVISTASTGILLHKDLGTLNDTMLEKEMEVIHDNTQYLSQTIDTFRDFLNSSREEVEIILQDEIKNTVDIVRETLFSHNIDVKCKTMNTESIQLTIIPSAIGQVILNIINNAKDVLILNKIENPWVEIDVLKEKDSIIITIEDNGGGVPKDIINNIFDPYFTTKHKSQGTGLGLHMSFKIVTEKLSGKLYVKNTLHGAKFFIELPLKTTNIV